MTIMVVLTGNKDGKVSTGIHTAHYTVKGITVWIIEFGSLRPIIMKYFSSSLLPGEYTVFILFTKRSVVSLWVFNTALFRKLEKSSHFEGFMLRSIDSKWPFQSKSYIKRHTTHRKISRLQESLHNMMGSTNGNFITFKSFHACSYGLTQM